MENKRKYPTQEDCQMLIDAMNRPSINTGTCSPDFKEFGHKLNERPMKGEKMFDECFGLNSPWSVRVKFNKRGFSKRELYWDKDKSILLKIN